jgi:hypothetical protein
MNQVNEFNNLRLSFSMRNDFFPYDEVLLQRSAPSFQDAKCRRRDVKDRVGRHLARRLAERAAPTQAQTCGSRSL